jgi:hypothetical protein
MGKRGNNHPINPFIIRTFYNNSYWTFDYLRTLMDLPMTNFTPEDLLLYLYKETSPEQTTDIEEALKKDWTLREKLDVLKTSMQRLDKIVVPPRTEVVLDVLNYAREKSAEEVK